jgi:GNAT superfamily N-acetyltransferase
MLGNPGFSIVCQGVTQGMMIVDTVMKRCRIDSQKGKDLVYVEYLENAPWNRKELLFDPPRYRGVGTVLIGAAIELSKSEGFKGRIGLHSLPQSNGFYANRCGMTDLRADADYQDLRYFEMTPEQAEAFIRKGSHP